MTIITHYKIPVLYYIHESYTQIFNMYSTLNSLTIHVLASEMIALFVFASPNCLIIIQRKKNGHLDHKLASTSDRRDKIIPWTYTVYRFLPTAWQKPNENQ